MVTDGVRAILIEERLEVGARRYENIKAASCPISQGFLRKQNRTESERWVASCKFGNFSFLQ